MGIGINTAVFETAVHNGASQLECLKTLTQQPDVSAIEVRGEFFKAATKADELAAIHTLCLTQGWDFYYSVPEELFSGGQLNAGLEASLKMADHYQIKSLKYSLGQLEHLSDPEVAELSLLINQTNVQVTIENQPNANGVLTTFERAVQAIQTAKLPLGYTFDAGNWYWIDQQPEPAFDALKSAITVFHLKDILNQTTVMLGDGATDWQRLVQALPAGVPVFLEYDIPSAELPGQIELVNRALS